MTVPQKDQMTRTVSVVIPAYNCGHLIGDAIDSALAQSAAAVEVIVVDDGSTDDTARRIKAYGDRIRYVLQDNQGVAAARNRGVAETRGEFVAFLDGDDVWHPHKLARQLAVLSESPQLGMLGTASFPWPAAVIPEVPSSGLEIPEVVTWEQVAVKNRFMASSVIVRRAVLDLVGPFDTSLQGPEDHDLWIRLAEQTVIANLRLPLTGYRDVPGSLSKRAATMERGMRRILKKLDDRCALNGRPKLRRKAYSVVCHRCSFMYSEAGDHLAAVGRSLAALIAYPWPYRPDEVELVAERPRRLLRILRRAVTKR
jgi:glycosyltransferase involved in cell wall biosynthesis